MAAHSNTKFFIWQEQKFTVQTIGEHFCLCAMQANENAATLTHQNFAAFDFGNELARFHGSVSRPCGTRFIRCY